MDLAFWDGIRGVPIFKTVIGSMAFIGFSYKEFAGDIHREFCQPRYHVLYLIVGFDALRRVKMRVWTVCCLLFATTSMHCPETKVSCALSISMYLFPNAFKSGDLPFTSQPTFFQHAIHHRVLISQSRQSISSIMNQPNPPQTNAPNPTSCPLPSYLHLLK
jgi:hypothetical protein